MSDSTLCGICHQRPATIHVVVAGPAPGAAARQAHICGSCCDRLHLDPIDKPEDVLAALTPAKPPLSQLAQQPPAAQSHGHSQAQPQTKPTAQSQTPLGADPAADPTLAEAQHQVAELENTTPLAAAVPTEPCPQCGQQWSQIQQANRLGCALCWKHFRQPLTEHLQRLHGQTKHVGTLPVDIQTSEWQHRRHDHLQGLLDRAVIQEDFKRASRLRDQLREHDHAAEAEGESST